MVVNLAHDLEKCESLLEKAVRKQNVTGSAILVAAIPRSVLGCLAPSPPSAKVAAK
jgi:hypothetical protein